MKPFIDKVTITGADNSVQIEEMEAITAEFPFVEWGILLSKNREGIYRFPSYDWMLKLHHAWQSNPALKLCGHICGSWVRAICYGNWTILEDCVDIHPMFARFQLNFHAQVHDLNKGAFLRGFDNKDLYFRQFIFQLDDVNNNILEVAKKDDIDAVPLFDLSGGNGVLPESWPIANGYCGYAGGLSPDNLAIVVQDIQKVAGEGPVWIDVETKVRSDDDSILDLDKVRKFLTIARPWVLNESQISKDPTFLLQ